MTPPLFRKSRSASVLGCVLAALLGAAAVVRAGTPGHEVTVEPRVVEATIGAVSLDRVDVSLRVALRASQPATIRAIAFHDAFVGRVPVWIERIEGTWPLVPGQELVIPQLLQIRMHVRDALAADDLGGILRTGAVSVRSSVEVAVETPRLARLLFMGRTRTLVRDVVLDLPIGTDPASASPLASLAAGLADAAQQGAGSWIVAGLDRLSGRDDIASRFRGVVASVTTHYRVESDGGGSVARERRAAGVWWTPAVFCTTREALAPWRFDVTDATALQLGRATLRTDRGSVAIGATRDRPALRIDLAAVEQALPAVRERKLYTLIDGRRERLRLGEREAASNLACLRLGEETTAMPAAATAEAVVGEVAAFAAGRSLSVVWTAVAASRDDHMQLSGPLYRASFGSPLVSGDRIVGLVASATTAWPAALVETAAAKAPRLPEAASRLEGSLHYSAREP